MPFPIKVRLRMGAGRWSDRRTPPPARKGIGTLEERAEEIVEDCRQVSDAVDHPLLRDHQAKLSEAVVAYEQGLFCAGQALAVVVTALLQWVYGHRELKTVRLSPMRAKSEEEMLLRDFVCRSCSRRRCRRSEGGWTT